MPPRARSKPAMFDRDRYPAEYARGVAVANQVISTDPRRVDFSLGMAERQLANWPVPNRGNPNTVGESKYAMTRGFADTLREYREEQAR